MNAQLGCWKMSIPGCRPALNQRRSRRPNSRTQRALAQTVKPSNVNATCYTMHSHASCSFSHQALTNCPHSHASCRAPPQSPPIPNTHQQSIVDQRQNANTLRNHASCSFSHHTLTSCHHSHASCRAPPQSPPIPNTHQPVSYTHLTLPTIYSV